MTNRPQIKLEKGLHRQKAVVFVRFAFNRKIINRLKETTPTRWSKTKNCWYIQEKDFNLHRFYETFKELAFIDYAKLNNRKNTSEQIKLEHNTYDLKVIKSQITFNTQEGS